MMFQIKEKKYSIQIEYKKTISALVSEVAFL